MKITNIEEIIDLNSLYSCDLHMKDYFEKNDLDYVECKIVNGVKIFYYFNSKELTELIEQKNLRKEV